MKHRIIATVTFEFEVNEDSYPGVENPDDRLLVDVEGISKDPSMISDMIMNDDATISVDGELVP